MTRILLGSSMGEDAVSLHHKHGDGARSMVENITNCGATNTNADGNVALGGMPEYGVSGIANSGQLTDFLQPGATST